MIFKRTITLNPTVDTAAYAAGDSLTTGAIQLEGIMSDTGEVTLTQINGAEDGGQAPSFTVLFFDREPVGATITANAAYAPGSSDDAYFMGMARIVGGDWYTVGSHSFMTVSEMGIRLRGQQGVNPYAVIVLDAAYDAVADNDLRLELHFFAEM